LFSKSGNGKSCAVTSAGNKVGLLLSDPAVCRR
jgi:hypothetical protein